MSYPRAIRDALTSTRDDGHNHKNGAEKCLVCQQHDLEAHKRARETNSTTTCKKCKSNLEAIDAAAKPVISDEKLEQARRVADRILGERGAT